MDDHVGKPIDRRELAATLARWLDPGRDAARPASGAQDGVLDLSVLDGVTELLGPAKMLTTLQKFAIELETRFVPGPAGADGRARLGHDAHVVASVSGMLGFADLSRCCAAVLALRPEDEGGFAPAAAAVVVAKHAASRRLVALLEERMPSARVA